MIDALHPCQDRPVTAIDALSDRRNNWTRFYPPTFFCPECHEEVRLRERGRGEDPFFFHLPRNQPCKRRVPGSEDNTWPEGAVSDDDYDTLSKALTRLAQQEFGPALFQIHTSKLGVSRHIHGFTSA